MWNTFHMIYKNSLEQIIDINIKVRTIKSLEETIGENICDHGLDSDFSGHKKHKP